MIFDFSLHPVRNERGEVVSIVPRRPQYHRTQGSGGARRLSRAVGRCDAAVDLRPGHCSRRRDSAGRAPPGQPLRLCRCQSGSSNAFNLSGNYTNDVSTMAGRYTVSQFGDECLRLLRSGKAFVVEDSETDARVRSVIDSFRLPQIRASICAPLLKGRRLVAAMAVHQITPRRWRPSEIELVQLVASRCWESIERVRVARELGEREQRFRFLAESLPQMIWTATPDGMFDYMNGQGAAYFDRPLEEPWRRLA